MLHFQPTLCSVIVTSLALLFSASGSAVAFNPQPEPPGSLWHVEGFIDMTALEIEPTAAAIPFGVDRTIIGDSHVDFRAGIIATFPGADRDRNGRVDDAVYTADLEYFRAQIGNADWDETMPNDGLLLQVDDGLVTGVSIPFTFTMPAHPDLQFMFPASPGAWEAVDERSSNNVGTIAGTYELRDGIIPEPVALSLVGMGLGALTLTRRSRK